jgi:hypothetical protein
MSPRTGRSPSGGLAAQTGWIGSVARFWEVYLLFLSADIRVDDLI